MPSVDGVNYPGPYQLRVFYNSSFNGVIYDHVATLNIDLDAEFTPGDDFDTVDVMLRNDTTLQLDTFTDNLVTEMQPFLNSGVANILRAELWKYASGSYDAAFQSVYDISLTGTSGSAVVPDSQTIWSMRSQAGGHGFFEILHTSIAAGAKVSYAAAPAIAQSMFNFLAGAATGCLARDGSYFFSPLYYLPGASEHFFKKRLR